MRFDLCVPRSTPWSVRYSKSDRSIGASGMGEEEGERNSGEDGGRGSTEKGVTLDNEHIVTHRTNNYYRGPSVRESGLASALIPARKYESEIREHGGTARRRVGSGLARGRYSHNRTANRIIALLRAWPCWQQARGLYRVSLVSPIIRVVC